MVVNLNDLSVSLDRIGSQLRLNSNSLISGLNSGVSEIEDIFSMWQAVFGNNFQIDVPGSQIGSIGETIAGAISMTPNLPRHFEAIGGTITPIVRVDGTEVDNVLSFVEPIQAGVEAAVARLDAPDGILDRRFDQTDVDTVPDFTADSADAQPVALNEVITAGHPLALTHAIERMTGGLYQTGEIINSMTAQLARQDLRGLVEQGFQQLDFVNPDIVEGALAPLGQIQVQIQENLEEMQSEVERQLGSFNIDSFFNSFGNFSGFLSNIQNSISQFETILNQVNKGFEDLSPNISGALVDDVIRMIDPEITDQLQQALGTNIIPPSVREDILRNMVQGDLQAAAEIIQEFETGLTDLAEITDLLESLEIDPIRILEGPLQFPENVRQIVSGITSWAGASTVISPAGASERPQPLAANTSDDGDDSTYAFDYVDTAEEFEADIASSTRELNTVVLHFTNTPSNLDVTSEVAHDAQTRAGFDGLQFHYIIRRNGRVQRGRPISATGVGGENVVDIAFVGGGGSDQDIISLLDEATTITQQRSYRDMMKALFRVIPGADVTSATTAAAQPVVETDTGVEETARINPPDIAPFNPNNYHDCVHGRGGGGPYHDSTISPFTGTLATPQPGVSTGDISGPTSGVDGRHLGVLSSALSSVGLRVVISPRGGHRPNASNGRHGGEATGFAGSFATDINVYNGDVHLRQDVREHAEYLNELCRQFISNAVSNGWTPSIGLGGNGYMNTGLHHFDIARTLEFGMPISLRNGSNYWGASNAFFINVASLLSQAGLPGPADRVVGPSGAVSRATLREYSGR